MFQFTHPGRGATAKGLPDTDGLSLFQFTHPGRGATKTFDPAKAALEVSIHAPREGCDAATTANTASKTTFQFTHPGRGATRAKQMAEVTSKGFNSRTPGGVRPDAHFWMRGLPHVSIHAPREGCDFVAQINRYNYESFNSRTPGGVRLKHILNHIDKQWFQFTHPGRGATSQGGQSYTFSSVSIHAPREGCDSSAPCYGDEGRSFNSRTPGGVRPRPSATSTRARSSFNSRTPGGVRLDAVVKGVESKAFQFTHPGRGATKDTPPPRQVEGVSIHAPREGCD